MQLHAQQPIGIFDSGIGGLTVANAISSRLPNEQIVYFGDTAHLPYGDKSAESICSYADRICRFMIEQGCKLMVIACNTASSVAYDQLYRKYSNDMLIVNVVDPICKGIAGLEKIKKIGVIGTEGTIRSGAYQSRLKYLRPDLEQTSVPTPLLASMIEAGFINNTISQEVIKEYLSDSRLRDIDALILACTHYPLIRDDILSFYRQKIRVYDSTDFVAIEVMTLLNSLNLLRTDSAEENRFYLSDYTESFEKTARLFFGDQLELNHYPIWKELEYEIS